MDVNNGAPRRWQAIVLGLPALVQQSSKATSYMTPELLATINGSCILILRVTSTLAADLLQLAETRPDLLIDFGVGCIRVGDGALCLSTEHTQYVQTLGDLDLTKYAQECLVTLEREEATVLAKVKQEAESSSTLKQEEEKLIEALQPKKRWPEEYTDKELMKQAETRGIKRKGVNHMHLHMHMHMHMHMCMHMCIEPSTLSF